MSIDDVKLRGRKLRLRSAWPLGQFPHSVIINLGKQVVHRLAVGAEDITGDDFATLFAKAIGGDHRNSPLGVADVVKDGNAWSVKTVQAKKPFQQDIIRLISGRNSPDYSLGVQNLHEDIQATGRAVLSIWNARINEALKEYEDLRVAILVRNLSAKEFVLFEEDITRYAVEDYIWSKNKGGNLEGQDKVTKEHKFTWQFHGAQFTIKRHVPGSAIKFKINRDIPLIEQDHILQLTKFTDDWIEVVSL